MFQKRMLKKKSGSTMSIETQMTEITLGEENSERRKSLDLNGGMDSHGGRSHEWHGRGSRHHPKDEDQEALLEEPEDLEDQVKRKGVSPFGCIPSRPKVHDPSKQMLPKTVPVNDNIVRSGHLEFQTLYATNDVITPQFTVNRLGAPNNSTMMCGCDNISCPFCNVVMSIRNRDPELDA